MIDPLARLTDEQRLLLVAVLRSDDTAVDAFRTWRARTDLGQLDPESNRLLPLLARRIDDLAPDDAVRARVRGVYRHAWVKNHLLVREAATLVRALDDRDVEALVLKGGALVRFYDGDWGRRPMYDLDLLVRADDIDRALTVLDAEGWQPELGASTTWVRTRVVPRRHSYPFTRGDAELDIHWHVLAQSIGHGADETFWDGAVPLALGDVTARSLGDADVLLHVIAHGARDREAGAVQWIADAAQIIRSTEPAVIGPRIRAQAERHALVRTVERGLRAVHAVTGDPKARSLVDAFAGARPSVLERLADDDRSGRAQLLAASWLAQGGLRPVVRGALDTTLVDPVGYGAYLAAGRSPRVAAAVRRRRGAIARTAVPVPRSTLGETLDFGDATVADRHAGPGWWAIDEGGVRSHGREARVVIDPDVAAVARDRELQLSLGLRSTVRRAVDIEVRVNEVLAGVVTVHPVEDPQLVTVSVDLGTATRFRPVEIALVAPRSGGRRGRLGVQLAWLRLDRSSSSG